MKKISLYIIIGILVNLMLTIQVKATLPQVNYLGRVAIVNVQNNTIEIQTEKYSWGAKKEVKRKAWTPCDYTLEISAPTIEDIINSGDYLEFSCFGTPGECYRCVSLGKLLIKRKVLTNIYGDPTYLKSKLLGSYTIGYTNVSDCSSCSGNRCQAKYTVINISREGNLIDFHQLYPGQSYKHVGEEYCINIAFHSGQAYRHPRCTDRAWVGPQSVSNFTIHISKLTSRRRVRKYNSNRNNE